MGPKQHPGFEAVLDDRAARNCAASIGVPVRGTLGILLLANREGHMTGVGTSIEALRAQGLYLDQALVDVVLALAGE